LSTTSETTGTTLDWLKWLLVIGILGIGVYGNWYYQDQSLLYRVAGLIVLAAMALGLAVQTARGSATWTLMKESRSEIRRVVWPSWDETFQTTMIVLVLVLVFSLILWGLDSILSLLVSETIG